jgi:hypothetical protein
MLKRPWPSVEPQLNAIERRQIPPNAILANAITLAKAMPLANEMPLTRGMLGIDGTVFAKCWVSVV